MSHFLFLAWCYARFNRMRTLTLVAAVAVVCALPWIVAVGINAFERTLTARAATTPLVVGAPGGRFDLVLSALYYRQGKVTPLEYGTFLKLAQQPEGAQVFPIAAFRTCSGQPLVGTTLEYLDYRGLRVASGRMPAVLGEAVLGSRAAAELGVKAGDSLLTDQTALFDLAKNPPLRLRITGVLAETGTPDDRAVFCDLKTEWIAAGLGHGHDDVAKVDPSQLLKTEASNLTASAAVRSFVEITPENLSAFHFHGDTEHFPISSIIVAPASDKARVLLKSRWNEASRRTQALESRQVVDELLEVVFKVERFFNFGLLVVACACLLVMALVFNLSLRLRRDERDTLFRIGAGRHTVAGLLAVELAGVVTAGLFASAALAGLAFVIAPWIAEKVL